MFHEVHIVNSLWGSFSLYRAASQPIRNLPSYKPSHLEGVIILAERQSTTYDPQQTIYSAQHWHLSQDLILRIVYKMWQLPLAEGLCLLPSYLHTFIPTDCVIANTNMQLPSYMLAGLATSVAATKLYVSDYSTAEIPGNVTSFSLSAQPKGSPYLIERISSTQSPTYQPSWLTKNPENDILYLANEFFAGVNGTISTFKTSSDGQLSLVQNILTKNGPVHTSIYNQGKALVSAE